MSLKQNDNFIESAKEALMEKHNIIETETPFGVEFFGKGSDLEKFFNELEEVDRE